MAAEERLRRRSGACLANVAGGAAFGHPGVVDDRGKFIYIEQAEMEAMAQFIKKKGRVRISALAQESSKLIDLEPKIIAVDDTEEDVAAEEVATGVSE